tara:strand:+ start:130 stop:312 length:183 start_codon:yes stop_codon:yes gene_type:complete
MINRLLSCERTKWLLMVGVIAIGAGFTAKNVISYSTECMKEEMVNEFVLPVRTLRDHFTS